MLNLNKVLLIGRVTENPQNKIFESGGSVTNIKIITIERNKNTNIYNWHRIIFYNNLAKIVKKNINKNDLIYIEGRINNRKWIDKDQNTRYISEIISNNIKILKKNKKEEINNNLENLENLEFNKLDLREKKINSDFLRENIISEMEKFDENEIFEYKNNNLKKKEKKEKKRKKKKKINNKTNNKIIRNEVIGNEVIGNEVIGNEVIGNEVIGNEIIGNEDIGNEVIGSEVIGNEVIGNENIRNEIIEDNYYD